MSSSVNLQEIHNFAVKLAQDAGAMITASSSVRSSQSTAATADSSKKNRVDLVTETDQKVEAFVMDKISKTYPSHQFIGEESFAAGKKAELTTEPTWIVDPIDGTTNFVHMFDHVCISIGFTLNKQPVVGVIFNPFLNKLYSAIHGKGAFLNATTRLPLSYPNPLALDSLGDCLIGCEWGSSRDKVTVDKKGDTYKRLAGDPKEVPGGVMAHSLRSIGSAALNYAYVAAGQLDLYWEVGCWSWDVCAGIIIAREAGCKVLGKAGKEFNLEDLMGHNFFVIRAIGDTTKEKGTTTQDRLAKDFFKVCEE